MRKFVLVMLAIAPALCGCGQGSAAPADLDPFAVIPGQWGWADSNDCAAYPKVIRFNADREKMFLSLSPVTPDGTREPRRQATYDILRELPNGLSMSLPDETRHDASGRPVTWDLIVMDKNQMCWHRSDWPQYGCTRSISRCGV
jgi:hypothetical protein